MELITKNPFLELNFKEARELMWKLDFQYNEDDLKNPKRIIMLKQFDIYYNCLGGTICYDTMRKRKEMSNDDIDLPF